MAAGAPSSVTDLGVHCVSGEPNTNQRDPMTVLPMELVAECFRRLDLRDCIAVSHVSRAWRTAALADCWMWNEYKIAERPDSVNLAIEGLSTLLSRSHPAPFHFSCSLNPHNTPDVLYDLLDANLHRMAVLDFVGGVGMSRLLRHGTDAPLLRFLIYDSVDEFGQYMFPAGWGARNAPRLQYLTASELSLPSDAAPFTSLLTFRAHWTRVPQDFSLVRVFPNLQLLELHGVTSAHIAMLTPLPPSLEELILWARFWEPIDYSPLLRTASKPFRIRKLHVSSPVRFHDALALFAHTWPGPWKIVHDVFSITLHADACDKPQYWHMTYSRPISLRSEPAFAAHLAQLTALELPFASFADLHSIRAPVWNRKLPALRTLVLVFPTSYNMDDDEWRPILRDADSDSVPRHSQAGILMPALECMEIRIPHRLQGIGGFLQWLEHDAPVVLPWLFSNGGAGMAFIRLTTNTPHEVSHANMGPLLHLTERVVVGSAPVELVFERSSRT